MASSQDAVCLGGFLEREELLPGELRVELVSNSFLCLPWVCRLDDLRGRLQGIKTRQKMQKK